MVRSASDGEVVAAAWGDDGPEPYAWSHGPWAVSVRGDDLADVAYAGARVLLAVRAVVRDAVWNTVPASVTRRSPTGDGLTMGLRFTGFGADLEGDLVLAAIGDSLSVRLDLASHRDFDRARIGLVVLLPAQVAGRPLAVTSPGGTVTATHFPRRVAPHQPAVDIAALEWATSTARCHLRLGGDTFEMEDQRNWTDASFKIYSTPLDLPYPVRVEAGARVMQSLTLTCSTTEHDVRPSGPPSTSAPSPRVRLVDAGRTVPTIGLGASTAPGPGPRALQVDVAHLLVELDAASRAWPAELDRARQEAGDRPLDVKVVADGPADVDAVVASLVAREVARLTVHSGRTQLTEPDLWEALVAAAAVSGLAPGLLYGGARSDFTELNRHHDVLPPGLPALCFSVTPQVHATDVGQIVASVAMQQLVTAQAVEIAAGRPVHVGPVTLRPRYNPSVEKRPEAVDDGSGGYGAQLVPMATDPRQASAAAATWLLASAAAIATGGAASITYAETWGPRGIVDADGGRFPVAEAVDWLTDIQAQPLLVPDPAGDPPPDDVWVVGARAGGTVTVLAANLTAHPVTLAVAVHGADQHNNDDDQVTDIVLAPFGSARTTLGEGFA